MNSSDAPDIDPKVEKSLSSEEPIDITPKDQIAQLIAAGKESAVQEVNYLKARASYSAGMIAKGSGAILIAILFVLVAFMSLGIGILLILEPLIGILLSTILTVAIFLSLSAFMVMIGRYYFKKLSFPELSQNDMNKQKENEKDD